VVDIGFLPERRGRGVGRTLLEWAQQSARAAGAEGIDLQVTIDNPRARALYQRLGFRAEGEREGFHQRMVWTSV
jgi:ribosomal protein S18 acetylase RimI-like enzyme